MRNPKWLNEVRGNSSAHSVELLSSGFFTDEDILQMDFAGYGDEFEAIAEFLVWIQRCSGSVSARQCTIYLSYCSTWIACFI